METFVGLDVSLKETSVCVLNQAGTVIFEGKVVSEPKAITRLIRKHATNVARVGLESGPTSVWLSHVRLLICPILNPPTRTISANPRASLRSDLLGLTDRTAFAWRASRQASGRPSA